MAFPNSFLFLILIIMNIIPNFSESNKLTPDYYKKTCPTLDTIVRDAVVAKQLSSPTTAAATLRLFFHDCLVGGCDASVLISSNMFNKAERDADINLALPGDGFDVVVRAKTSVELACPGVVSCADILALAARDLVNMVGGPYYNVMLGRMDGLESNISAVEGQLPRSNTSADDMIKMFGSKGFSVQETVALAGGARTVGFSHCKEFAYRLFNFSKGTPTDPAYHPVYADALKKVCKDYVKDEAMSAYSDAMTPSKFDHVYFQNLKKGMGLLESDNALVKDPRTLPFVNLYAANQTAFFDDFSRAIEKLSMLGVNKGTGEVRRRCDVFNSLRTNPF